MPPSSLAAKLRIGPENRVLLLAAPDDGLELLGEMPDGVQITEAADTPYQGDFDVVMAFVRDKAAIDRLAPVAFAAVRPGGIVWIAYPKLSSGVKTDITRDVGWETVDAAGWKGVTQIAVDATWSALRFRPEDEVGKPSR